MAKTTTMTTTTKGEFQTREYAPAGPVVLAKTLKHPEPEKPAQPVQKIDVPLSPKRKSGCMYDAHSGHEIGLASDEMKAQQKAGIKYTRIIGGMKQEYIIEP